MLAMADVVVVVVVVDATTTRLQSSVKQHVTFGLLGTHDEVLHLDW
jgi:hypothetical protein